MADYLIVGAGLFGAVCARELTDAGKSVLVIDRRNHVAGNAYTEDIDGICVHRYGPHIFHTDDKAVWEYVNRFAEFNRFTNAPLARYKEELFSLPFNMHTFRQMWGVSTPEGARSILEKQRAEITGEPRNLEQQAIRMVGRDIYEKLVKGYTEKQWGRDCSELPPSIIRRLPVRFTYDNSYFSDRFQGIPEAGYTSMVENILSGIDVRLGVDYLENREELGRMAGRVIYTGPIDAFFNYRYGPLEYRGLRFETEKAAVQNYQGNAVINYTDPETPWTRIIEHKWFSFGKDSNGNDIPHTVITREYPTEWKPGDEPFYPINDAKNTALYARYKALADKESRVIFGGRLGEYRYCDMDQTIQRAMHLTERIIPSLLITPHDGCAVIPTALGRDKPGR